MQATILHLQQQLKYTQDKLKTTNEKLDKCTEVKLMTKQPLTHSAQVAVLVIYSIELTWKLFLGFFEQHTEAQYCMKNNLEC